MDYQPRDDVPMQDDERPARGLAAASPLSAPAGFDGQPVPLRVDFAPMPASIVRAIASVMSDMEPIGKDGTNKFHQFDYTTADAITAEIQPRLAAAGLVIIQTEDARVFLDPGPDGRPTVLAIRYNFYLMHESGDMSPPIQVTGMAGCRASAKSGAPFDDKASNKCMTGARKFFLISTFQIPRGNDSDPDQDGYTDQPSNGHGGRQDGRGEKRTQPPARPHATEPEARRAGRMTESKPDPVIGAARSLCATARAARTAPAVTDLLRQWQRDANLMEQIRGRPNRVAWDTLLKDVTDAISNVFGSLMGDAWRMSLEATTTDEIDTVANLWINDNQWKRAATAMKAGAPEAYEILRAHMAAQEDRILAGAPPLDQEVDLPDDTNVNGG